MNDKDLEATANAFALELLQLVKEFMRQHPRVDENTMGVIMLATYTVITREFNAWAKRRNEDGN